MSVIAAGLTAMAANKALTLAGTAATGMAMSLMSKAMQMTKDGQSIRSLADVSRPARVEPLVLVESQLADQDYMPDVMKSTLSIFIGYWMQAATMTGTKIGGIDPLKAFNALNPNRSSNLEAAKDLIWSKEAYAQGLPSLESFQQPMEPNLIVSIENREDELEKENRKLKDDLKKVKDKGSATSVNSDAINKFYEIPSLVTGKLVEVELRDGENSGKFPVQFRLLPTRVPAQVITHIFTATSKNNTFRERYHLWRAGQLRFIRDLVFAVDLVDAHRKALVNDTSNVYATITDRRRNNSMAAAASKTPSMADASNIAIISKATAKRIGSELYGKIESSSVRQKIFDSTYLLLLVVVDEQWERVTIYHRGYDQGTEASFRDLKVSEKGKGPDIAEILRAYSVGATPTI